MPISTEQWVVVEREPLRGVDPATTFHEKRQDAEAYIDARLQLFGKFDLARVVGRKTITYNLVVTEETE